jgi:ribosomal protein L11 methyltransferase
VADSPQLQGQDSPAGWLEVSLVVDGELAEAVAEVFSRFAPEGVVIQSTGVIQDETGLVTETGPLKVCAYLPEDSGLGDKRQRLEEALWYLGRIKPLPAPEYTRLHQKNWAEAWKAHYRPIQIGKRLLIQPAWVQEILPGRIPVLIEPGMAFGTGTHPTTQLCLEILESFLQPGQNVIDVGCGSGILSIAAVKLGAGKVLGVDVDRQALDSARYNARLNEVEGLLILEEGSVEQVLAGDFKLRQAPLVLANILATVIVRLLDQGLAELVTPGGYLVLSGILEDQLEGRDGYISVLEALSRHSLQVVETRQIQDWIGLVVRRI